MTLQNNTSSEWNSIREIDSALLEIGKSITILDKLNWGPEHREAFLNSWKKGIKNIPLVEYPSFSFSEEKEALQKILTTTEKNNHPIMQYLGATAKSYYSTCLMLESAGTPDFSRYSIDLYGDPEQPVLNGKLSLKQLATQLLRLSTTGKEYFATSEEDFCIQPKIVAEQIERYAFKLLGSDAPEVFVDNTLASRAAAGAKRIRIRESTCFSELEILYLSEHECGVHTTTAINGRYQSNITCLSLGAPRTLRTQEGIAVFAELITGTMSVPRLRRLALRVLALEMALQGANFIDLFEFYLKEGQTKSDAFQDAYRLFRGGDPNGKIAFTKDVVYLAGLIEVYDYLEQSIISGCPDDFQRLFCGRIALEDLQSLDSYFNDGTIQEPKYLPDWMKTPHAMGTTLLFSGLLKSLA